MGASVYSLQAVQCRVKHARAVISMHADALGLSIALHACVFLILSLLVLKHFIICLDASASIVMKQDRSEAKQTVRRTSVERSNVGLARARPQ